MPRLLLDLLLAVSITFSVLVLLASLIIVRPLEFSAFPTVLLIATMLRPALNLASTRLTLGDGYQGSWAAGRVIQAFGSFIMQGNFVIGLIVFAILVIEFRGDHQELRSNRRGLGALFARRHARQADGDRCRSVGGPDRRARGAAAPAPARGGEQLLQRHGRRRQVRARRCHRRPADHVHQPDRGPDHRGRPDGA